ncbi:MAG: peptide-binding protein [Chloroflexota bacterium]
MRSSIPSRLLPTLLVLGFLAAPLQRANAAPPHAIVQGGVVTVAEVGSLPALNPLFSDSVAASDVTSAVFDSLVRITPQGTMAPDLATHWSRSPDGLHWTFTLAHNVVWHDAEPFTAKDVIFTARLARAGVGAVTTLGYDHIASIQAVGTDEVVVTLTSPYAPFLTYYGTSPVLPEHVLAPLPLRAIKTYEAFNRHPIGTGPYAVTTFIPGQAVTLAANSAYFGGKPRLDGVTFRFLSSDASALSGLRDGSIDMLGQTLTLSPAQYVALRSRGGFHTFATPGGQWSHLDLIQSGFLLETAVRRALAYATPRQELLQTVYQGLGTVADADQPPYSRYYNPAVQGSYPFDIHKARQFLVASGFALHADGYYYKKGRQLAITLWGDGNSLDVQLALKMVQRRWRQAGVAAHVRLVDEATLFGPRGPLYNPNRFASADMNAVLFDWINASEPEDSYFWQSSQIVTAQRPGGGNYVGYSNPEVDRLTAAAAHTSDDARRRELYYRIQHILVADEPVIFLAWHATLTVTSQHTHGVVPNPYNPALTWNSANWYLVAP